MSALRDFGDISSRQKDLRQKLLVFRRKVREEPDDGGLGFGESKAFKENVSTNVFFESNNGGSRISTSNKTNHSPGKGVIREETNSTSRFNRVFKDPQVDSMAKLLKNQLDSCIDEELRDQEARKEEREELKKLRAEMKYRVAEKKRAQDNASKMLNLEANLQKTQARLGLAMQHINEMAFEKSVMEQQLAEWKNKISTHVSNVREMAMIKQREKDLLQRARRDREREFRTLKENFEKEKNSLLKEKKSYEEKSNTAAERVAAEMQKLQCTAMGKIRDLESEISELRRARK